ncbi:MAG: alpha/beta hydrolase [Clostridia bacterium]|nr:alpha/beta hydrolase [Clostridia bacterium]
MIREVMKAKDGKEISIVLWEEVENPVGIIQISHGMAEHAMRYHSFAKKMNERGIIVVADDHRAHGHTDLNTLGYSAGNIWEDTLSDMDCLCDYAKDRYSKKYGKELSVVLFGHSYGSFLTQAFIRRHANKLSGAIIGGSHYFVDPTVPLGKFIAKLGCVFGGEDKPNNFLKKMSFDAYNKKFKEGTFISSIPSECDKYKEDNICGFVCSSNFYYNFFKGLSKLYKKEGNSLKDFKILLVAGDNDPVGNFGKGVLNLEKWYKKQEANVKCKIYEGVRHEYLNDTSREDVTNLMEEFAKSAF